MKTALVIDGTNRAHVFFHACGRNVDNAVWHFAEDLAALVDAAPYAIAGRRPGDRWFDASAVAFDRSPSFRRAIASDYKATRPEAAEGLAETLRRCEVEAVRAGVPVLTAAGIEADDMLATVAACVVAQAGDAWRVVLASPDKDMRQCLVPGRVSILRQWKRTGPSIAPKFYTAADFNAEFGLDPKQWVDVQTLAGDDGDNVTGAEGVGIKTASAWLRSRSLAEILGNRWCVKMTERQWQGVRALAARVEVVRQLVTLRVDVDAGAAWALAAIAEGDALGRGCAASAGAGGVAK